MVYQHRLTDLARAATRTRAPLLLKPGIGVAGILVALSACAPDYSPDKYASNAVQQANKVEQGLVVGVRPVAVTAQGVVGAATGGAAGGALGSQTGSGITSTLGAIGGTVVGGLVGSAVEQSTDDVKAFEYVVRKTSGELVSVTQKDVKPLPIGQKVLVIAGNQARIVPDYTVAVDGPGAPAHPTSTPSTAASAQPSPPVSAPYGSGSPVPVQIEPLAPAAQGATTPPAAVTPATGPGPVASPPGSI